MNISIDKNLYTRYFRSQDWSECSVNDDAVTLPNNNSIILKNNPYDGDDYDMKPYIRGGAISYNVDISSVGCGCVAGLYAVQTSDRCGEAEARGEPTCASIDIMQANHGGFNTAAHPCKNGECDAKSQCQYNMAVEGKATYGDGAYGRGGSLINTNKKFNVKTEFISTTDYQDLWKLRTILTQGNNEIVMEARCEDYLSDMSVPIEGNMAFVMSSWDNTDYRSEDFECKTDCPAPEASCENATFQMDDFQVFQWGYTEEIPEDEESEDEEDPRPEPAKFEPFVGDSSELGSDWEFFVKGLDGSSLTTDDRSITMGPENRAFVLDYPYDDDYSWAYWHTYLGSSLKFDITVADMSCGCAASVYLT